MEGEGGIEALVKPGDLVAGKYRLAHRIGTGGMGAVFLATHVDLDEKVAIKFLLPSAAKEEATVKRFLREARAVVKLKDEHVVRVFDIGKLDCGLPYIVMEHLEGRDLGQLSVERGTLPVSEAVDLVLQATRGVAEAHAAKIVHRDLKPANLFVTKRRDGSACVKVLDFGISKSTAQVDPSALTQTAAILGSPAFMAPEQWLAAKDIDARADIWALGSILFQLLAGRTPFDGDTVAQLCTAVLHKAPASLRELRPDVPEGLAAVILRTLEKEREARHADVAAFARALVRREPCIVPGYGAELRGLTPRCHRYRARSLASAWRAASLAGGGRRRGRRGHRGRDRICSAPFPGAAAGTGGRAEGARGACARRLTGARDR